MKFRLIDTLGNTPIIKLQKLDSGLPGNVYVKLESHNPGGSVKDRIAFSMISDAENKGVINESTEIIEPTSGNTGIGLAMICAYKSYKLKLFMPENMSEERKKLMRLYGAELVLTDPDLGMKGAVEKAFEYKNSKENVFMPLQFENNANPAIHYYTTGQEIWNQMNGNFNLFVAGIGSGGTITGCGVFFKENNKNIKIIGIEPETSAVINGNKPGKHGIQGLGAGFIPKVLNLNVLDKVELINEEEAKEMRLRLMKEEGISCGYSSGANVAIALKYANMDQFKNKNIVTVICDTGERYLA
ncbi:MAG: cysteine synthase A [Marinilabiliales bacterium]